MCVLDVAVSKHNEDPGFFVEGPMYAYMRLSPPQNKASLPSPNPASPDSPDARPGAWPPRGLPAVCKCRHLPGGRAPPPPAPLPHPHYPHPRAAAGPPVWAQEGVRGKWAGNESSGTRGPLSTPDEYSHLPGVGEAGAP